MAFDAHVEPAAHVAGEASVSQSGIFSRQGYRNTQMFASI